MRDGILTQIAEKKHLLRSVFLAFALSLLLPVFFAPLAHAVEKYGPIGSPGLAWRDDIVLNGNEGRQKPYPEMVSISCADPKTGKSLTGAQKDTIRTLAEYSLQIYLGNFKAEDRFGKINLGDSSDAFKEKTNYGIKPGENGFNDFLRGEKKLLRSFITPNKTEINKEDWAARKYWGLTLNEVRKKASSLDARDKFDLLKRMVKSDECKGKACSKSAWSAFSKRSLTDNRKEATDHGAGYIWAKKGGKTAWVDNDGDSSDAWSDVGAYNDTWKMTKQEGASVAGMINANAKFPTAAFSGVPAGCPLPDWNTSEKLGLGDFFGDISGGFARLILAIPSMIIDAVYGIVYPQAWKYAFYTPHTERGDTIFNMETTCSGKASKSCSGFTELGFNKDRLNGSGDKKPLFLKLTSMVQWLLSGTYFLILFASAVLFIFRGKRGQTLQLMKIGPRIALVLMFTFAAPFLMGAVISISNLLVMSILGFGQSGGAGGSLAQANITASLIGAFFAEDSNGLVYPIIKFATGLAATIASVMVLASVYIRQLLLIILVITAPIAIFCLIVDSWRPQFKRWIRTFMVVSFFPVILGIILKIGMLINPVFSLSGSDASNFSQGDAITSFVILIIMFWAMARAVKMAQGMIGNPGSGAMGMAGGMIGQFGQGLKGYGRLGGAAGMALGAAGYGLGRASQAPTDMKAALVPGGRGSMSGQGLFSEANGAPGGAAPGLPGKVGKSINEKFSRFAENGQLEKNRRAMLRKDRINTWMNEGKLGPRRIMRNFVENHSPKFIKGKPGSLRHRLYSKAAMFDKNVSAAEGDRIMSERLNYQQQLVRSGKNKREAQALVNSIYGSEPRKQADGSYKMKITEEVHKTERKRESFKAAVSAFEHQSGRKAEIIRNASEKVPTDIDPETGKQMYETVSKRVKGADHEEFTKFIRSNHPEFTEEDIQKLAESSRGSSYHN
jgi:hypothetical protein